MVEQLLPEPVIYGSNPSKAAYFFIISFANFVQKVMGPISWDKVKQKLHWGWAEFTLWEKNMEESFN